jgi:hypothetical protein
MRFIRLLPLAAVLFPLAAATSVARAPARDSTGEAAEVGRIRAHFDSVLTELAVRDEGGLTSAQRARRAILLDMLRAYRDRGVFPHNYDFPGEAVPYFVDRKTGTLCAVAYLLASTGRRDVVDRVARADDNVRVAQLAGDTAVTRWLDANGLTLAEAARIQVPYMAPETSAQRTRNAAFLVVAPVALGGSAIASIWNASGNADGHRRAANVLGVASGVVAVSLGAALLGKPDVPRGVGVASAALGGISVALATRAIGRRHAGVAVAQEVERRSTIEASVAPFAPAGSGTRAGVAVSLRY